MNQRSQPVQFRGKQQRLWFVKPPCRVLPVPAAPYCLSTTTGQIGVSPCYREGDGPGTTRAEYQACNAFIIEVVIVIIYIQIGFRWVKVSFETYVVNPYNRSSKKKHRFEENKLNILIITEYIKLYHEALYRNMCALVKSNFYLIEAQWSVVGAGPWL